MTPLVTPESSSPPAHTVRVPRPLPVCTRMLLIPGLLWLVVFFLVPLGLVFLVSLASRGLYGGVEWRFSLESYRYVFETPYLWVYGRSLALAVVTTGCCLLLGFPLAYYIARLPPRRQAIWLLLVLLPFWTNFLVRTYAWMFILGHDGLLNALLLRLGLIAQPLEILYTDLAVVLGLVYGYLPFMVLPLYVALVRLDRSLLEAARDLYASGPSIVWRVLVPLARPGIVAGSVLVFIPTLGAYVTPDLLGGARSMMLGNLVQHEFLVVRDWPLGAAISFVLMAMVTAAALLYWRSERLRGSAQWGRP